MSTKIYGILDETEIFKKVKDEFSKSKRYSATIMLLTADGSKLKIFESSLSPKILKMVEKISDLRLRDHEIDLKKSTIFSQVLNEGKTVICNISEIIRELLPQSVTHLISKVMGYEKKKTVLTPLKRHGKTIGVFAMSSTTLAEYLIPSVRNLIRHISIALELARENAERKKVEEALKESEGMLRNIFEASPDAITVSDLNGNIVDCNQATLDMHGYSSKDELIGKSALELIAKKDHGRAIENLKKTLEQGLMKNVEYTFITKDGREFPAELSASVVRGSSGNPIGFVAITKDITERKRMEKQLTRERDMLHALMDNIPDAIYFKDVASRFTRINMAHAQRIGLNDPKEAIGKTDFDFYPEEFARETYADEQKIMKMERPLIGKIEKIKEADGHFRWVSATKVPIKDRKGKVIGIVGISRDVTKQKLMEEELREYTKHLEELVEERTRKLKEAERMHT